LLFRNYLKLGNATIDHVVREIQYLPSATTINRRKTLLLLLTQYIRPGASTAFLGPLRSIRFIPVIDVVGNPEYGLADYERDIWYAADRTSLLASFRRKVPIIDFDVDEVTTLLPLIKAIARENYLLSKAVVETLSPVGFTILDEDSVVFELRERAKFLLSYVLSDILASRRSC